MQKKAMLPGVLLLSALVLGGQVVRAQDSSLSVVIKATTERSSPNTGEDDPTPPIETSVTTLIKGNMEKQESRSDVSHNIVIVDKGQKKTTQLYEMGGRKFGYYSIDTGAHHQNGDSNAQRRRPNTDIQYTNETKTISGFNCKKAVATTTFGDRSMTTTIWYTTDLPFKHPIQVGRGGFGNFGMDQLNGFPIVTETTLPNGSTFKTTVTKVELNANISDSEFDIPRGYDVKPESERPRGGFGGGFGGGFRGGGGGGFGGGGGGFGGPPPGGGGN